MKLAHIFLSALILSSCQRSNEQFVHRIGYINPNTAIGDPDFKACNEEVIYDYYNVSGDGANDTPLRYEGGMRAIKDYVFSHYDPTKFTAESGYLSVHFVVNCNGESGRFEYVESSLNFEAKSFSNEIKAEFMQITQGLKGWTPQYIRGANTDCYAYLTYKLKNGEILEILP